MEVTYEQLQKINTLQIELLKQFISVCQRLNLKYYVVHGTLLGAIQYKGFIPWDDDIDVAMPRDDYEIFLKYGAAYLEEGLFIQANCTDPEYPLGFAKIRNSQTTFIQKRLNNLKVNQGVYIDIFPIDYFPKKRIKRFILNVIKKVLDIRIGCAYFREKNESSLKLRCGQVISKMLCPSWEKAFTLRENLYTAVSSSETYIIHPGKFSEKNMPAVWFADGLELKFEGLTVVAPKLYNEYLTRIYGDYMNYSPAEEYVVDQNRVRLSAEIIDLEKPYTEYIRI